MGGIPKNDPLHPRWLLDTDKWAILEYQNIKADVLKNGYGIISYTWGRWATWDGQPPPDLPSGLQWQVPVVKELSLSLAQKVVSSMNIRYVWWDWMCVPQRPLKGTPQKLWDEFLKAKGEEVGKQMAIYKGAKKSIVWLHRTSWGNNSPIEKLLMNQPKKKDLPSYLTAIDALISDIQKNEQKAEPWLTSGWTLQEGVLLSETHLLDHDGKTLRADDFIHEGQAAVVNLTAGLTNFAIGIAAAFLRASATQSGSDQDEAVQFIRSSEKNYQFLAQFLSRLLRSGLIAYTRRSPLYILAGKFSRNYGVDKDECWALLGALELANVTPWYDETPGMDQVKSIFFERLLQKYQWSILLVAGASADNQKLARLPWHTKVTDGKHLPLGIYFDVNWEQNLPNLSWKRPGKPQDDAIQIQNKNGAPFAVVKLREKGSAKCRRYEQLPTPDGADYIRVLPVKDLEHSPALFLPIAGLGSRPEDPGTPGARYIEIALTGTSSTGKFRGVVEIWAKKDSLEEVSLTKLSMLSGV